ncbi:glycosyltransferase [Rothia sp. (in: high G+C Gram-positive bacteria)]|uniref:glycosyltransferase n=1 Tax=Rothia sp. (in: high G+C Gram-positive bacteria) TaxID=1885016 RepID=UPI00321630A4
MHRIGYVLKVYPRFSETFVVTEILAREAAGADLRIYAMRPTTDARFHPELARVKAPVTWVPRPTNANRFWQQVTTSTQDPEILANFASILPELTELEASDVAQGIALAQRVKADGITHLHAHFASLAGRMAWVASKLTGIPYTVTTHAKDIFHESVNPIWLRRICGDAAQVLAISMFNEGYLQKVLTGTGANIVLLYNALELSRFEYVKPSLPTGTLRIAAVGRFVPKKGFSELLDAVAILAERGVDFSLTLGGDGELDEQLRQKVEQLGLTQQVTMPGPLTQAEVRQLLRSSHVFVAPCVPAGDGNMDGLPTVVLEAMACGVPVVTTSVTGLPEVIRNGETGLLLEPGDVPALADALASIAYGDVDTPALAEAARQLIEQNFDSNFQAQRLNTLETTEAP